MSRRLPNEKEKALIQKIQSALSQHYEDNRNPADPGYSLKDGVTEVFQDLCRDVAALIQEQGGQKTCAEILAVARKVQTLTEGQWKDGAHIYFAVQRGLWSVPQNNNPFSGMKL